VGIVDILLDNITRDKYIDISFFLLLVVLSLWCGDYWFMLLNILLNNHCCGVGRQVLSIPLGEASLALSLSA
jgi:hypothetical protein